MDGIFATMNGILNSIGEYIPVELSFVLNMFVAPPIIAFQHFVVTPIGDFFGNLFN